MRSLVRYQLVPAMVVTPSAELSIAVKELIPIVVAAAIWSSTWATAHVHCRCDNMAVMQVLNAHTAHDKHHMHLRRCLHFIEASYNFVVVVAHIPGVHNDLADDLSRDHLSSFLLKAPWANPSPFSNPSGFSRGANGPPERLDIASLEQSVQSYCHQALAQSTIDAPPTVLPSLVS